MSTFEDVTELYQYLDRDHPSYDAPVRVRGPLVTETVTNALAELRDAGRLTNRHTILVANETEVRNALGERPNPIVNQSVPEHFPNQLTPIEGYVVCGVSGWPADRGLIIDPALVTLENRPIETRAHALITFDCDPIDDDT